MPQRLLAAPATAILAGESACAREACASRRRRPRLPPSAVPPAPPRLRRRRPRLRHCCCCCHYCRFCPLHSRAWLLQPHFAPHGGAHAASATCAPPRTCTRAQGHPAKHTRGQLPSAASDAVATAFGRALRLGDGADAAAAAPERLQQQRRRRAAWAQGPAAGWPVPAPPSPALGSRRAAHRRVARRRFGRPGGRGARPERQAAAILAVSRPRARARPPSPPPPPPTATPASARSGAVRDLAARPASCSLPR